MKTQIIFFDIITRDEVGYLCLLWSGSKASGQHQVNRTHRPLSRYITLGWPTLTHRVIIVAMLREPDRKRSSPIARLKSRLLNRRKIHIERIPGPFASLYEKASRMARHIYYAPIAKEIISRLPEGRILDAGTGPGYLPVEIARRSSRIWVVGIDLSRALIRMARRNALSAGVAEKVHFEVGNASSLRWADGTYDMVISTGMLHTLKDPVRVLKECRRVLKPGGQAWIYDPARVSSQIDLRRWKDSFTFGERILYRVFLLFARINPGRVYKREQVVSMIQASGFLTYEIQMEGKEIRAKMTK